MTFPAKYAYLFSRKNPVPFAQNPPRNFHSPPRFSQNPVPFAKGRPFLHKDAFRACLCRPTLS